MRIFPGHTNVPDAVHYIGWLLLQVVEIGLMLFILKWIFEYTQGYTPDATIYIFFLFLVLIVDLRGYVRDGITIKEEISGS